MDMDICFIPMARLAGWSGGSGMTDKSNRKDLI